MGGEELFFRVGWLVGFFVHEVGSRLVLWQFLLEKKSSTKRCFIENLYVL